MMRKAIMTTCIATTFLLCGCSRADMDSATKQLTCISIWEGELGSAAKDMKCWSLSYSTYNGESSPYAFTVIGTFENGFVDEYGLFSKGKGDNIFQWFENCEKQRYEPNHPNTDGLLVTEYEPYSVKAFYTLYDSNGNAISNTADPRYDKTETECYYTLSEDEYNDLRDKLEELRKSVESSKQE